MIYTTHRVSLDIHDTSSQFFITVKRGVTNRQIAAYLTEDGKPYTLTEDCYAVFDGKKEDGGILHNSCIVEGNCIKYNFTEATVSAVGKVDCELKVYGKDGALIATPTFTIIVEDSVVSDDDIVAAVHESTELERMMASYVTKTDLESLGIVEKLAAKADAREAVQLVTYDDYEQSFTYTVKSAAVKLNIQTLGNLSELHVTQDGQTNLLYLSGGMEMSLPEDLAGKSWENSSFTPEWKAGLVLTVKCINDSFNDITASIALSDIAAAFLTEGEAEEG